MYIAIGIVVFCFIAYFVLTSPKRKAEKEKNDRLLRNQLLNLFKTGEKLTVVEVSERLEQRTGRRKSITDLVLYEQLGFLVREGRLTEENKPVIVGGNKINQRKFSLPR